MKISNEGYDDSIPGSKLKRIFYTVELDEHRFVDIMISEECRTVYAMQNEDGSTVYGNTNDDTYPKFIYDEEQAISLARAAYEKEYGKLSF